MKMRINLGSIFIILATSILLFIVGFNRLNPGEIELLYQVYLNGERVGLISNKEELYNLIDQTQEAIKSKYNVDKVYPPAGLTITEYKTYNKNLKTAGEIYEIIRKQSDFTIQGYTVTIKGEETEPIYIQILNREDLEPALLDAVSAFIPTDNLKAYMDNNQIKITDTGKTIEKVYFEEKITIKEDYLSVNSDIITNQKDLTKFLLFGTLEKQESYTVKEGDTVENVAYNNRLSNEELLIANPNLASINSLLSAGQKLNIGLINPLFTVVEESEVIEDIEKPYATITEKDSTKYASESYVKQKGVNGILRVTEKILSKNGEIMTLVVANDYEISAPIDKIVIQGTKVANDYYLNYVPPAASSTDWVWPTSSPYVITSRYKWRWGKLHGGIDVSGSGFGSPLYSATDGIVTKVYKGCANNGYYGSPCGGGYGNYVEIRSTSGLTIYYAHNTNNVPVSVGQAVSKGQVIGFMGNSGSSTGTHLHFEIRDDNGTKYDPCKVAFKC